MARRRWDYFKIAQGLALVVAASTGAHPVVAPSIGLIAALRPTRPGREDEAFVEAVIAGIGRWCDDRAVRVDQLDVRRPGWDDELRMRLQNATAGEFDLRELLLETVFVPMLASLADKYAALADELSGDMPEIVLGAGDPHGTLRALRALQEADVARLEELIGRGPPEHRHEADRALVVAYLTKLIRRVGRDSWSAGQGADRADLAAIQQPLTMSGGALAASMAVDDVVGRCERLVVLGGPGAGKSWTARRAVILSAESSLQRLAAGADLAAVELPLFAACSQVLGASDVLRWERLVNASLGWASTDPGQAGHLAEILRTHRRTLIVLDGLDEAENPERAALDELLEARLRGEVRVIVTSRPDSWDATLLHIAPPANRPAATVPTEVVASLDALTATNAEAAVAAWLADAPEIRDRLLDLLRRHSSLADQVRVPLLCALICLIARPRPGGEERDLSEFLASTGRLALLDTAIDRLLEATWRDRITRPDADDLSDARRWLEALAESGADDDPTTGLGHWPDSVAPHSRPPGPLVDHVAPIDWQDGRRVTRRFVHRALREHLLAAALSGQAPDVVAGRLVDHLWLDPDWAEVIPAVLAGHDDPDRVVDLVGRQVRDRAPDDPTRALDRLLVATAALTRPDPSTPRRTEAIDAALAATLRRAQPWDAVRLVGHATHWPAVERARRYFLAQLDEDEADPDRVGLVDAVTWAAQLSPPDDGSDLLRPIVRLLSRPDLGDDAAAQLIDALAGLAVPPDQVDRACRLAVGALASPDIAAASAWRLIAIVEALRPGPELRAATASRAVDLLADPATDEHLVDRLLGATLRIGVSSDQRGRVVDRLVDLMSASSSSSLGALPLGAAVEGGDISGARVDAVVDSVLGQMARWDWFNARPLASVLRALTLTSEQEAAARGRILEILASPDCNPRAAAPLADELVRLGPSPPEVASATEHVFGRLTAASLQPDDSPALVEALVVLDAPAEQRTTAARRLLDVVAASSNRAGHGRATAHALSLLRPIPSRAPEMSRRMVEMLGRGTDPCAAASLTRAAMTADPPPEQVREIGERLVGLVCAGDVDAKDLPVLIEALEVAGPTPAQASSAVDHLLDLLEQRTAGSITDVALVRSVAGLAPHLEADDGPARRVAALLEDGDPGHDAAIALAGALAELRPDPAQVAAAARRLGRHLAEPGGPPWQAAATAQALLGLTSDPMLVGNAAQALLARCGSHQLKWYDERLLDDALVATRRHMTRDAWIEALSSWRTGEL
jgi:hypothetical protein